MIIYDLFMISSKQKSIRQIAVDLQRFKIEVVILNKIAIHKLTFGL